jgi:hypothetical protein
MEFAAQKQIKRQESWILDLPNLKEWCFVPNRIEFWTNQSNTNGNNSSKTASDMNSASTLSTFSSDNVPQNLVQGSGDIEVSFYSGQNCVYKWGLPYFKINSHLDLSLFLNKIGEGENISLHVKNIDKDEKDLVLKIIYREYQGNIIYHNSYDNAMIQIEATNPLNDLANAGLVTKIQIQCDTKMQGVMIEPIFHIKEDTDKLRGFPLGSIVVEADEPTPVIEIGLDQLQEYQNAMKYFKMRIMFDETADVKDTRRSKIHIVAHGFKN